MLTDGLGLLGGSLIFLYFGEKAYEALLGFGFGGTLLALFMRVGGGIYTKAADVGADLVGKIEADIPEDDPRNAATIADNVGDNVGDCAGMAADIFESYEVTIVAAMILGYASFGHKGVIFPLLVRAIGVIGSIISTYSVKAGDKGDVEEAMKSRQQGLHPRLDHQRRGLHHPRLLLLPLRSVLTVRRNWRPNIQHYEPNQPFWVTLGFNDPNGTLRRARHAAGVDLLYRHHPGHRPEQMHRILDRHRIRAGQEPGQELPHRPCHQHHSGHRRRLREHRLGGHHHRRGHPRLGADLHRHQSRSSSPTASPCAASAC